MKTPRLFSSWLLLAVMAVVSVARAEPSQTDPLQPDPVEERALRGLKISEPEPLPTFPTQPVLAPTDPQTHEVLLDIKATLNLAWQNNLLVKQADSRVRQSYWRYQSATAIPPMVVGPGMNHGDGPGYLNSTKSGILGNDHYFFLNQSLAPLGTLETNRQLALHDLLEFRQQAQLSRIQVAKIVKDAFYSLAAAQELQRASLENLRLTNEMLMVAQRRLKAGAGPAVDVWNAEIQRNRAEQDLHTAEGSLLATQATLCPQLGFRSDARIRAQSDMTLPDSPVLYEQLSPFIPRTPRIQFAQTVAAQSRLTTKLAKQQNNLTPNFTSWYDLTSKSYGMTLELAIPVDWGSIRNTVNEKIEAEQEKDANLVNELLGASSDLKNAVELYSAAEKNAKEFRAKVLEPSEKVLKIYTIGFVRGAVQYLQLLQVQQQVISARQDFINRVLSAHLALDQVELTVGKSLRNDDTTPADDAGPTTP